MLTISEDTIIYYLQIFTVYLFVFSLLTCFLVVINHKFQYLCYFSNFICSILFLFFIVLAVCFFIINGYKLNILYLNNSIRTNQLIYICINLISAIIFNILSFIYCFG